MGISDSTDERIRQSFEVMGHDFSSAGAASSKVKRILQQIGVDPGAIRRIAVASYEAEMNVVIHADSGHIALDAGADCVRILVKDVGPGIENIAMAMVPGYSTASDEIREMGFGAGMGLPNMKSCADVFEIESEPGVGTTVRMIFFNR